jgi:hypothetical protein
MGSVITLFQPPDSNPIPTLALPLKGREYAIKSEALHQIQAAGLQT